MLFYILNTSLEVVDVIETYKSYIWTTRYFKSGDFELYIPATHKMINMIKQDYYIIREDDPTQCMIIKKIQITTSIDEGNFLIVTGPSLKSILDRRIIWQQTVLNGYVEQCIRQLISANCIRSTIAERNISNLILGAELGITDKMSAQYTGDNLGEVIRSICNTFGLGYDIILDLDSKKFIFILYKGTDRSYNQNAVPYVVFSNEYENLLKTDYSNDTTQYKNVAKVAGEGEGTARKSFIVGNASGMNRYELFVDARDLSTNEGEIDTTTYNGLLAEKGNEALAETIILENIEGEVEANHTYKINEDYFLGDVVEVINEYGMEMTPRITEVIESEDESGHYTIPTFSTNQEEG